MLKINILVVLLVFAIYDNVSSHSPYLRRIHYPVDERFVQDCQLEYSGYRGVCKRFSECESAQKGWVGARIYPTICYYDRFDSIVCCLDAPSGSKQPIINNGGVFHSGIVQQSLPSTNNQFPSSGVNNQAYFPNVYPVLDNGQQSRPSMNNQFPSSTGNSQGNLPNQFPDQQSVPSTGNQFPSSTGNNQGSISNQFPGLGNGQQSSPSTGNQFPSGTGNSQQSIISTGNQFPSSTGNNQGTIPNQFPGLGNGQQSSPSTGNQFPSGTENSQGNFPVLSNEQQSRPSTDNQFPTTGNNQVNPQNTNNQIPVITSQVATPDQSDCTVVVIEDENTPLGTNCVVPAPNNQNQGNIPNQFPVLGNGQQNSPNTDNQFPSGTGNNQGNIPNQFPSLGNGQQNSPNTDNQFPSSTGIIQGNFPNQFPISGNGQQNQPSSNNQFPSATGNNQNQFGQSNTQSGQTNSDSTVSSNPVLPIEPEEQEYQEPRISQNRCDLVYDVTSLVGGEPTKIGQYPFMAAIGWKTLDDTIEFRCGGFLVSRKFVLTAAHCAILGGDKPAVVRTGGINLDNMTSSDLDIPIEEIIVHPNYKNKQVYNDIALIRLSKSSRDEFACLWQRNEIDKEYEEVKAIGYGHIQFGGPSSSSLLQIKLKLFDNNKCSPYYRPEPRFPNGIINSQICSGDVTRAKDTCQGDSGGPIFIERISSVGTLTPVVIGITSFGQGCAGEAPSIYTRISAFLDWIEAIVWK